MGFGRAFLFPPQLEHYQPPPLLGPSPRIKKSFTEDPARPGTERPQNGEISAVCRGFQHNVQCLLYCARPTGPHSGKQAQPKNLEEIVKSTCALLLALLVFGSIAAAQNAPLA